MQTLTGKHWIKPNCNPCVWLCNSVNVLKYLVKYFLLAVMLLRSEWLLQASVLTLLLLLLLLMWTLSACFVRRDTAHPHRRWCDLPTSLMSGRREGRHGSRWGSESGWLKLRLHFISLMFRYLRVTCFAITIWQDLTWGLQPSDKQIGFFSRKSSRFFAFNQTKLSSVLNTLTNPSRIDSFREKIQQNLHKGCRESEQKTLGSVGCINCPP